MAIGTAKYRKGRWFISTYYPDLTRDRVATVTSISITFKYPVRTAQ